MKITAEKNGYRNPDTDELMDKIVLDFENDFIAHRGATPCLYLETPDHCVEIRDVNLCGVDHSLMGFWSRPRVRRFARLHRAMQSMARWLDR